MKQDIIKVEKVSTKCYDCETETQCFIDHEVFENGHDWHSEPRCCSCYKSDKVQVMFEDIFGSGWKTADTDLKDLIPIIRKFNDKELYQFLAHVGCRMEF